MMDDRDDNSGCADGMMPHITGDDLLIADRHRPTRADAVKNRELILETAVNLFDQHGVEDVSMTQIAQAAGIGKGTLYRHFNNKTELCHALLDHDMRELQNKTLARLQQPGHPINHLQDFLRETTRFVYRNNALLLIRTEVEQASTLEFPAHIWWRQTIRGLLTKMNVPGDLDYISDLFYVMLDANTIRFQRYSLGYDLDRIQAGLISTLERIAKLTSDDDNSTSED